MTTYLSEAEFNVTYYKSVPLVPMGMEILTMLKQLAPNLSSVSF